VAIKMHLAELYLSDGKFDAFEEQLSKIVLQLRGEGRATKLLQVVESFYERSNRHLSVLRRLAELYADLHQEERALELVRTGLAQDPEDRDLRLLALRANLAAGNLPEARRMALSLFHNDPRDLFILEQLASIARARGDSAELAQALRAIAKVHEVQGSPQERDASYRKLLELCPDDAEARLVLGDVTMEPVLSEGAGARPEVVDLQLAELEPFIAEMDPQGLYLCLAAPEKDQPDILKRLEKW
jgi:tetratricopeptide (TPR) repeat protein